MYEPLTMEEASRLLKQDGWYVESGHFRWGCNIKGKFRKVHDVIVANGRFGVTCKRQSFLVEGKACWVSRWHIAIQGADGSKLLVCHNSKAYHLNKGVERERSMRERKSNARAHRDATIARLAKNQARLNEIVAEFAANLSSLFQDQFASVPVSMEILGLNAWLNVDGQDQLEVCLDAQGQIHGDNVRSTVTVASLIDDIE